jgi:hypothetical protein
VDSWFRDPKTAGLRDSLRNGALVRSLGFSRAAVDELLARHAAGADCGRRLFALVILETWATQHIRTVAPGV